jgi:hypothetical protein
MQSKKIITALAALLIAGTLASAAPLKGMSLNGSTGLVSIPTGRIGWERTTDLGLDFGYHAIVDDETSHIPKATISLFKLAEIGFAYDSQPGDDNEDTILHGKVQLPMKGASAVAIGGNYQMLQTAGEDDPTVSQLYLAATYPGEFFGMPAETTVVVGKSFIEDTSNDNIDFGMGFDLLLFPDIFEGYIHWINDFANFSYSAQAYAADANSRGVFNSGIRIDLASIPAFSKYKFAIDAIITDALDENRAYSLGVAFGIPIGI